MNNITTILAGILAFVGIATIVVLVFTTPTWYIWNHIIVHKFDVPTFSFWEAFWTLLMIRFMFPSSTTKTEKK